MHHRLIMVSGSSPGAGKSTASEALARQLARHGSPCRWLSEGELLRMDGFAQFDEAVGSNDPDAIEVLLAAARTVTSKAVGSEETWITDALLPGFFWLCGRYPPDRVAAFSSDVAQVLAPLRPLIVYLEVDVARAIARATQARGAQWLELLVRAVQRWRVPYCPDTPLRTFDDVLRFFWWLNQQTLELLARWPGPTRILHSPPIQLDDVEGGFLWSMEGAATSS